MRTVSELTSAIKRTLNESFDDVWVRGEITSFKRHGPSGHLYFSLKDEGAVLSCAMWRTLAGSLRFAPGDGIEVEARGNIDVYARTGRYQLIVRELLPAGRGALLLALDKLRRRLAAEGLFAPERKRALPPLPRRVAVLTSPTGAAVRDFLRVLGRRWPLAEVVVVPVPVQGEGAAERIAKRIGELDRWPWPEVVVLTRGGGSLEDLWAFNEEVLVRAVAACRHPVLTGIGHEVDHVLAEDAADVAAPTPSAAAEWLAPDWREVAGGVRTATRQARAALERLLERSGERLLRARESYGFRRATDGVYEHQQAVAVLRTRLARSAADQLRRRRDAWRSLRKAYGLRRPEDLLVRWGQRVAEHERRLRRGVGVWLTGRRARPKELSGRLLALSPKGVLARGYALARRADGRLVRRAAELSIGESLHLEFGVGSAGARVETLDLTPEGQEPAGRPARNDGTEPPAQESRHG